MTKKIHDFFTQDHHRLEALLEKATADFNHIDTEAYHKFRQGLLTHIKMEEKIVFKIAQEIKESPIPLANELRLEHGALTSLMVPPPTPELVKVIQHILEVHDIKEEERGGMYDICEELIGSRIEEVLEELRNTSETPIHPNKDIPLAWEAAKRACLRAGFDYDEIAGG